MKIIYIDLDGVVADFDKGKKEHPLGGVTPYIGKPINCLEFTKTLIQ